MERFCIILLLIACILICAGIIIKMKSGQDKKQDTIADLAAHAGNIPWAVGMFISHVFVERGRPLEEHQIVIVCTILIFLLSSIMLTRDIARFKRLKTEKKEQLSSLPE